MSPLSKKIVKLKAELVSEKVSFSGFIENLSDDEIYLVTMPCYPLKDLISQTPVELKFKLPSEEALNLSGIIKCSYKTPPHGLTNSIVIEVKEAHPMYKNFVNKLH